MACANSLRVTDFANITVRHWSLKFLQWLTFFALAACEKPVAPSARPPQAEFLLAAGDSTYWIRSSAEGLHVRSAPILLTRSDEHFYEVFISDDLHDFDEASFANARAYRRDIMESDSLLIFQDGTVSREATAWKRANPRALPVDPAENKDSEPPPTVASDDIEVIDVHGPWLSFAHTLDVDVAGRKQHAHRKRRGVLDLRTGTQASLRTLFGDVEAARVQTAGRQAFKELRDSVQRSTDLRGAVARKTLASFTFDSMSFGLTDSARGPAVAFLVPGVGADGEALTLFLPPIRATAPTWWNTVAPTLPAWNADSSALTWSRNSYDVLAHSTDKGESLDIALIGKSPNGVTHNWPIALVQSPAFQLIALDVQPIDSATRTALAHAFDQARTLNGSAQQASWSFGRSTTQLQFTTFRACPISLMRQSATHMRRFASRNFVGTSSACLRSRLAFRFRVP